jgi:hypothetical protein
MCKFLARYYIRSNQELTHGQSAECRAPSAGPKSGLRNGSDRRGKMLALTIVIQATGLSLKTSTKCWDPPASQTVSRLSAASAKRSFQRPIVITGIYISTQIMDNRECAELEAELELRLNRYLMAKAFAERVGAVWPLDFRGGGGNGYC